MKKPARKLPRSKLWRDLTSEAALAPSPIKRCSATAEVAKDDVEVAFGAAAIDEVVIMSKTMRVRVFWALYFI
jgi:hypothetical protein